MKTILDHLAGADTLMLVGDYGSGKTEVAVNLALRLVGDHQGRVAIADLDLVNPYFRCREAREPLEGAGIQVVVPEGGQQFADLPILLPHVKGVIRDEGLLALLDVGGDEVGSRVLASLAGQLAPPRARLWFVLNARRPFNDTLEGCLETIRGIEGSSGLRASGLVSNTHLMDETTPEMVLEGVALAESVAAELDLPLAFVALMEPLAEALEEAGTAPGHPLLSMRRIMVPPWLRRDQTDVAARRLGVS